MTHEALWELEKCGLRTKLAAALATGTKGLVMVLVAPALRSNHQAFAGILERPAIDSVFAELATEWLLARRAPSLPEPEPGTIPLVIVSADWTGAPETRVYVAPIDAVLTDEPSSSSAGRALGSH